MNPDKDEATLIAGVIAGNADAFRTLYRLHAPPLYRLSLVLTGGSEADAQDLMQETWLRAVRALDRFEGRSSLRTWLRAIVSRCAAERYRRNGREVDGHDLEHYAAARAASVSTQVDLERVLLDMPPGFRTVLILHDLEGFRHTDIGELLGISPGTSKSQLSRARKWVRAALGEDYDRT